MKLSLRININKDRPPYTESIFNGPDLISKKPGNVLAYYDVTILNTGKVSIFDFSLTDNQIELFSECDEVFGENDSFRQHLFEMNIESEKIDEIMELVFNNIYELRRSGSDSIVIEVDI